MKNERCLIKKIVGNCLFPLMLIIGMPFMMGAYYEHNVYTKLDNITIELGDKLPDDIINYMGVINTSGNFAIESNVPRNEDGYTIEIGTFSYYLVYNDMNYKFSKPTNVRADVTVIDTVSPIIKINEDIKFKYGSKINVSDIASCEDLSGCELFIDTEIDTNKSGEYEVKIIAVDGGNNKSYSSTKITVLEKPKPVYRYNYSNNFYLMNNKNNLRNSNLSESEKNSLRYQVVEFAKKFIGNPYVYGGTSLTNGTDCSGFTMSIYNYFGYNLPRVATSQNYVGKEISYSQLLPGDIVVYHYASGGGHVGIYAGNGMMIHAGTSQTGIIMGPMFSGYRTYRRIIY